MRKTHLQIAELSVSHLDSGLSKLHQQLSDLYILLNRPLDNLSQEQALAILHRSMSSIRTLSEDKSYILNSIRGIDSDLESLVTAIKGIRAPQLKAYTSEPESTAPLKDRFDMAAPFEAVPANHPELDSLRRIIEDDRRG